MDFGKNGSHLSFDNVFNVYYRTDKKVAWRVH